MSALEEYQKAIETYQAAKLACIDMVSVIERANRILSTWNKAVVSNIEAKFPKDFYAQPDLIIDAHEWPDAQKITKTLELYHSTKENMAHKRSAIPLPARMAVVPLPD